MLGIPMLNPAERSQILRQIKWLDKQIEQLEGRLNKMDKAGIGAAHGRGDLEKQLIDWRNQRFLLDEALKGRITSN